MSTPLFKRYCEMNINGRVLAGPPFRLEFETEFSVKSSNQTTAMIYNPSDETVEACERKKSEFPKIIIDAGYEADFGTCVAGEIIKFEVKNGKDRILKLTITDKTSLWLNAKVNKSWKGSIDAKSVITQIFSEFGITPGKLDLGVEKIYSRGVSFTGMPLSSAMKKLEQDTKSDFFFKNGQAYFLKESGSVGTAFYLSPGTGLLSAEKFEDTQKSGKTAKGYNVRSLFLYQLGTGSLVELDGNQAQGLFKVISGKHKFSTRDNSMSEFRVMKV